MSGVGCLRTTSTARRNARQHYVKRKRNLIGSVQLLTLTIGVLVVHQLSRPMDREGLQPTARIAGFGRRSCLGADATRSKRPDSGLSWK